MATLSTKAITAKAKDISLVAAPAGEKNKFCEIWPNAKVALNLLQSVIKNPVLKVIIGTVISTGDAVAARIC